MSKLQDIRIKFHNHLNNITLIQENYIIVKAKRFKTFFLTNTINVSGKTRIIQKKNLLSIILFKYIIYFLIYIYLIYVKIF